MGRSSVFKLFGMVLLLVAISILISFIMIAAVGVFPPWGVNLTFIWVMFMAGYAVGRLRN